MNKFEKIGYYFITYSSISKNGIFSDVKNALNAGCKFIQYREKNKNTKTMIQEAKKIKNLCTNKATFIINDRVDVALAVNADGVHLGQDDMTIFDVKKIFRKDKIIGLTVHNVNEAVLAEELGADYVALAPIFKTFTKKKSITPCGVEMIKNIRKKINIPIIAVGGIKIQNINEVIKNGADGIVAVSSVINSDDVFESVKKFIEKIEEECSL